VIAHVELLDFFIAVERAARPDLAGRPVVVGGLDAARGLVASASVEARAQGVRPGMRVADALAAAPDAACLPGAIERYLEVSAQIDERLRACTRAIEWTAIDEAWLQIDTGAGARGPSLDDLRRDLARDFGLETAAGVGATKAVAAVASRLMRPAGLLIVLPGYEARLLAPVDIRRLPGLSDAEQARLRDAGVHSLGDLAALEEPRLHELIGCGGSVLARHALGLDDRPLAAAAVPKGIARSAIFGCCGGSQARGAVARLAEQAGAALRRSGHGARQIRLRVRDGAGERMRTQIVEPPAAAAREVAALADALALRLLHPGRELLEAAVFLTALTPVDPQLQLFASRAS
jgi:DNA polymerase IV